MKINLKDLPEIEQRKVKGVLKSNGLTAKRVNLYKDGKMIVIEIKATGQTVLINVA